MEGKKIKFVFMGGCGRSGTTLVQKLLLLHSKITGNGEFDFLPSLVHVYEQMASESQLKRQAFFYNAGQLKSHWEKFIEAILTANIENNKFVYLSEKTPNNIYYAEQLLELMPESKFIYVYRDGRDVVSSFKQVLKRANEKGEKLPHTVKDWALMWNHASYMYDQLKNNAKFNGRHIAVRYEDIAKAPEKTLKEIMSFLNLSLESQQLASQKENALETQQDNVWYTSGMYNQDITGKNISKWKNDLNIWQKMMYQTIMASKLEQYNYPVSSFYLSLNSLLKKFRLRSNNK